MTFSQSKLRSVKARIRRSILTHTRMARSAEMLFNRLNKGPLFTGEEVINGETYDVIQTDLGRRRIKLSIRRRILTKKL